MLSDVVTIAIAECECVKTLIWNIMFLLISPLPATKFNSENGAVIWQCRTEAF